MLKVTSFKICPFFQQVIAVLKVFDIPHQVEYTEFDSCRFDISPNGKAPILTTANGTVLFDSDAIIDYLLAYHTAQPADVSAEQQAIIRGWAFQASKNYVAQCSAMRSESQSEFETLAAIFKASLDRMEPMLTEQPWFGGDRPGLVDAAWTPLLHRASIIRQHTGYDFFEHHPNMRAWQHTVIATGLAAQSVPDDFEAVFTAFYLSDKTWLGTIAD